MSVLDKKAMNDLKWNYNYNLRRYINGCNHLNKNKKDIKKWLPELISVLENINSILEEILKYEELDQESILKGFDIEE